MRIKKLGPIRSNHLVTTKQTIYVQIRTWSEFGQFLPYLSDLGPGPKLSIQLNQTLFVL
jgi:hypothetical protein